MNEVEWLAATDPTRMVHFLHQRGTSDRRLRLFGCLSCRRVWHLLTDDRSREAILTVERSLSEGLQADSLESVRAKAHEAMRTVAGLSYGSSYERTVYRRASEAVAHLTSKRVGRVASSLVNAVVDAIAEEAGLEGASRGERASACSAAQMRELAAQCNLLTEIFGNPFRPVAFDPRWRTADTIGLARGIYEERAFDRMPLLADALMDAGCHDEHLLAHCRADGHVRGCWAVDLVVGKE